MIMGSSDDEDIVLKNYHLLNESINKIINNNILDDDIIDNLVDKIFELNKVLPVEAEELFTILINYYQKYNIEACIDYISIFYNFFHQEKDSSLQKITI